MGKSKGRGLTWGEFVRTLRLEAGYGLRTFAALLGYQPSNYSNMETGKTPPPKDARRLKEIAETLAIPEGTEEWHEFHDLAAEARKAPVPADVAEYAATRSVVPLLLRTTEGKKLSDDQIRKLIDYVNEHF
ncbi:MAG TPA: helix-turn-helix transcriptional regulator [Planctomycetota bacterium]|nr:helix-turn-helix transcriptional regulator [Planctomycetota bacterium]